MRSIRPAWLAALVLGLLFTSPLAAQDKQKEKQPPGLPLPDLEKLLPPGTIDEEQLKQLLKLLEGQDEQFRKMVDDLQKRLGDNFPGGQFLPGNFPGNMQPFGLANVERDNRLGATLQKP